MTSRPFADYFDISHIAPDLRAQWARAAFEHIGVLSHQGYDVTVSWDLADLAEFWHQHRGQPDLREFPNFDGHYWPSASQRDTLLCFLERHGRRVGACGYRLIELFDRERLRPLTLQEAFEERFLFYEQPDMGPANETCEFRAASVRWIYDCVVCVPGALWIEAEHQKKGLFPSFGKLSRILAVTARDFHYSYMLLMFSPKRRELAIDHFGMGDFIFGSCRFRGEDWEVAWNSRADAIRLALA